MIRTPWRSRAGPSVLVLVMGLSVLGLALRLHANGDKSLWLDEAFSFWMSTRPLREIRRDTVVLDTHPPLYYTLLHFWIGPGSSEAGLRAFSALWGAATVPVVYLIGREVGGRMLGVLAAGLQTVSPLHVAFGQEGRMYAMLTFFAAVAMCCMLRLLNITGTPAPRPPPGPATTLLCWAGFATATALTMLSHNTGVLLGMTVAFYVAALAVMRTRADRRPTDTGPVPPPGGPAGNLWHWVTAVLVALLLWLQWLPGFLVQSSRVDAEFWIPPPTAGKVVEHLRDLAAAGSSDHMMLPLVLTSVALVALGAWRLRHRPEPLLLLLLLVVAPLAGELLVSMQQPIFYSRTLIWTSVPFTVLLAAGLLQLKKPAVVGGATAMLLVLNLNALAAFYQAPGIEDWRGAAAHVAARAQPGDVVLFSAGWTELPFTHYYERTAGPPLETHGLPVDPFDRDVLEPKMAGSDLPRLDRLIAGRPRVWLVLSHDWYTDPGRLVTGRIGESMYVAEQRDLPGMRIQEYQPR